MTATINDDSPENHDPYCPRADLEQAWNGADCHCHVIAVLRNVEGVDIMRPSEAIEKGILLAHDPLCPPGLKAAPPDRCTWCVTIAQARKEGPLQ